MATFTTFTPTGAIIENFNKIKTMTQIDLTQILKDCPKGTKLYSPLCGKVEFEGIIKNDLFPVEVKDVNLVSWHFSEKGTYSNIVDSECLLFPSKDNRDWSTFKVEQPKPEHKFKPFDRVLVRDGDNGRWRAEFYSYYKGGDYPHVCVGGNSWQYCIPYEGNEHLLGTTNEPKED